MASTAKIIMSDDDAAILPLRVSNRILARVNASSSVLPPAAVAEIGANARLAVVSPYVRHDAAAGRAQADQEETDDAVASAVGDGVQANEEDADYADAPAAARGNEVLLSNGEVTRKCLEVRLMRRYYGQKCQDTNNHRYLPILLLAVVPNLLQEVDTPAESVECAESIPPLFHPNNNNNSRLRMISDILFELERLN